MKNNNFKKKAAPTSFITPNTRRRKMINMKTLIVFIMLVNQALHTVSSTMMSNYDFHGLSSGTTSIPCTVNPSGNVDWVFQSKS